MIANWESSGTFSSGNLTRDHSLLMANAMLEDLFKSSHPDLVGLLSDGNNNTDPAQQPQSPHQVNIMGIDQEKSRSIPTRKSVEFAIEPPPKRPKANLPLSAKQVVNALSISIAYRDRLDAVQKAKDCFNHDIQAVHDDEIAMGADAALTKHLTFLVFHCTQLLSQHERSSHDLKSIVLEISLTCDALESLYRASSAVVGESFKKMGPELLQLLVSIVQQETNHRRGPPDNFERNEGVSGRQETNRGSVSACCGGSPEADLMLRKATKIFGHFARVGDATKQMAHFPNLLHCLIELVRLQPREAIPWEARLSSLWTLANLACNPENMSFMVRTPDLINVLVEVACRPLHPADTVESTMEILRSRENASKTLLNLSWSAENKITLSEHTALLDLLSELTVHRSRPLNGSRTVQEISLTTRRYAVGALRNIAAAPRRSKVTLCQYKNGHILDVMTDAVLNDPDPAVRHRAFAAIANLAVHDTSEAIVRHPALVLALKDALLSDEVDPDTSLKVHASTTLRVLERSITPGMSSYENLRELLDALAPSLSAQDKVEGTDKVKAEEADLEVTKSEAV